MLVSSEVLDKLLRTVCIRNREMISHIRGLFQFILSAHIIVSWHYYQGILFFNGATSHNVVKVGSTSIFLAFLSGLRL